jgi:hypothetical protein
VEHRGGFGSGCWGRDQSLGRVEKGGEVVRKPWNLVEGKVTPSVRGENDDRDKP